MNIPLIILKVLIIFTLLLFLVIPIITIAILIKLDSTGPIIHWSKRIGLNNKVFLMPKFRTMKVDTKDVATHLLDNPKDKITKIGFFLRKTSLDEVPQIYSIIMNQMNFIGPRPALYNQYDLIDLRTKKNIHKIKPGITGLAQVEGRDELSIKKKVEYDYAYYKNINLKINLIIIFKTFKNIIISKNVKH